MSDKAILFDSSRCSACKGCQVSCKTWNDLPSPLEKDSQSFTGSYQSPLDLNGNTRLLVSFDEKNDDVNSVRWAFGRRGCFHCSSAACVEVCTSGALYKNEETGFVEYDRSRCIGCHYCRTACPFDVPRYDADDKINKCTGCGDRVSQGMAPACVKTCQPGALQFGDRDEMLGIAQDRLAVLQERGFSEAVLYGEDEMDGLHVITVAKFGLDAHGLPADPKPPIWKQASSILKPLTGVGVLGMLGLVTASFIGGRGYKRGEWDLHYDEKTGETIDTSKEGGE